MLRLMGMIPGMTLLRTKRARSACVRAREARAKRVRAKRVRASRAARSGAERSEAMRCVCVSECRRAHVQQ